MGTNYVVIFLGPCERYGTYYHRPQKCNGIRDHLRRLDFRVDIRPVKYINLCSLEICGHEVFRCNVKYLGFNIPQAFDPVAKRATDAVLEARVMFRRARDYLWARSLINTQIFTRTQYAPVDYFMSPNMDLGVGIHPDCLNCCGISVTKKKPEEIIQEDEDDEIFADKFFILTQVDNAGTCSPSASACENLNSKNRIW